MLETDTEAFRSACLNLKADHRLRKTQLKLRTATEWTFADVNTQCVFSVWWLCSSTTFVLLCHKFSTTDTANLKLFNSINLSSFWEVSVLSYLWYSGFSTNAGSSRNCSAAYCSVF